MEFRLTKTKPLRHGGFTLVELMVGIAIGLLVVTAAISFFLFGARSFSSMANYSDLSSKDRMASDTLTRDIRTALQVVSATTNQIVLQAPPAGGNNTITYSYDASAGTLTRNDGSSSRVMLTGLNSCSFGLYQRPSPTNNTYNSFPTAAPGYAKLVSYQWSAGRRVVGTQVNTESVQTALVYLRNR
jgi:prepilin-type N-terminal cleavage/methylation domain-containing protein